MKVLVLLFVFMILVGAGGYFIYTKKNAKPVDSCFNEVQDEDEWGVDCGGPCDECPSCEDGIQNQNEEGVDCGGFCKPCLSTTSCDDGIINQGEVGIDCGGPCRACPQIDCTVFDRNREFRFDGWDIPERKREDFKKNILNFSKDWIYLDPERPIYNKVVFDCKWGAGIGEQVDLYYCLGNYTAPVLNYKNVIEGYLFKSFKVGMDIEKVNYNNKQETLVSFKTINVSCFQAANPGY